MAWAGEEGDIHWGGSASQGHLKPPVSGEAVPAGAEGAQAAVHASGAGRVPAASALAAAATQGHVSASCIVHGKVGKVQRVGSWVPG